MRQSSDLRVAITYHYSLSFGGSERVLEVLAAMYPQADFFTLMVDPAFLPEALRGRRITTSFLDRIPGGRRIYRQLLPLYPLAVESLDLSGYDVVISADGAATKGVLTDQGTVHLCYCHSPPRSYWDQYASIRRTMPWLERTVFSAIAQYMRQWDFAAAQRIDVFIANSEYVAERILKYYRRDSEVIYPPVDVSAAQQLSARHDDFYLSVGRLVAAKRVDLAIEACNRLGRKLEIAGTGTEERNLRTLAGPTIRFLGRLDEVELRAKYAACRALIFAADEDFGLVAVEAQAHGRPVIAYGHGGSLETMSGIWPGEQVEDNPEIEVSAHTGVFFSEQNVDSLIDAVLHFERIEPCFDAGVICEAAQRFDTRVFVSEMRKYVGEQVECARRARSHRGRQLERYLEGI